MLDIKPQFPEAKRMDTSILVSHPRASTEKHRPFLIEARAGIHAQQRGRDEGNINFSPETMQERERRVKYG